MFIDFISEDYIKKYSSISDNVDMKYIYRAIQTAQFTHLEDGALGTNLYNKLVSMVSGGTLTGHYKTLMDDYIRPCLLQWVIVYTLPEAHLKITNKGVMNQNSENSTPVEMTTLQWYIQYETQKAEELKAKLVRHLENYSTDYYPEYNDTTYDDDVSPSDESYFCGIQFDNEYPNRECCKRPWWYGHKNS